MRGRRPNRLTKRLAAIEQRLGRLDEEIAAISKQAEKDSVGG